MADKLVSVIISSYNSSKFIIETIESVSSQTWKNIELIITDDCSGDNTTELCRNWLNLNEKRFINSCILISEKNTGVSANANRGLKIAKGNWIKFLGADDTLKPDCIKDNMQFITNHPHINVLFSLIDLYRNAFTPANFIRTIPDLPFSSDDIMNPDRSADSQYRMLLLSDRINFTPSVFLQRDALISAGGFDESFKMLEDYPLWLNLTRKGNKLFFMNKVTVNYRQHSDAINNTGINHLISPNYFKSENFRKVYTYPNLPFDIRLNQQFCWYVSQIFRPVYMNRNTESNHLLLNLLTIYLNPLRYIIWLRKRLNSKLLENEFYL